MRRLRHAVVGLAVAVVLAVAGCDWLGLGFTPIGDITREPAAFEGKEVKVRGTVHDALKIPLAGTKGFRLQDKSGEVMVWTLGPLPREGDEVALRGKVESVLIVAGESFGLAIKESERLHAPLKLTGK